MTGLTPVYKKDGEVVRNSTDASAYDGVSPPSADDKGFRLPTSNEWQLAARYQNGTDWTPGNHVSGDTTGPCWTESGTGLSTVFDKFAWYEGNSQNSTHVVGTAGSSTPTKPRSGKANALNIYDMSGNVWEWCFDWYPGYEGQYRLYRGGCWYNSPNWIQLATVSYDVPSEACDGFGFRIVKTQ